jgi:hypothetical protein
MMQEDDGWQAAMRSGNFSRAWAISDRTLRAREANTHHHLPRHFQRIWTGAPLEGRVLIRCYHGLGDTLQFSRYVPLVQQTAAVTTLWVQPALIEFLDPVFSGVRLLPLHDGTPSIEYDVDIEIMELAHAFRTTLETIPRPLWHDRRERVRPAGPPRIGLVWTSGNWDPSRNIPFELLHELLQCDVHWILLQEGATATERRHFDCTAPINTISTLAETMRSCDLVITVDTMAAHLAGSLDVATWTLLRDVADWRWMTDRSDSPWYPSMRLYRQRWGDWRPVLHEVAERLNTIATTRFAADRPAPIASPAQPRGAENMGEL